MQRGSQRPFASLWDMSPAGSTPWGAALLGCGNVLSVAFSLQSLPACVSSLCFGFWQSLCFGQVLNINLDLYLITWWCVWNSVQREGTPSVPSPGLAKGLGMPEQESAHHHSLSTHLCLADSSQVSTKPCFHPSKIFDFHNDHNQEDLTDLRAG